MVLAWVRTYVRVTKEQAQVWGGENGQLPLGRPRKMGLGYGMVWAVDTRTLTQGRKEGRGVSASQDGAARKKDMSIRKMNIGYYSLRFFQKYCSICKNCSL